MTHPVILMRPGEANNRLASRLEKEGVDVWRWPAFTIALPEQDDRLRECLADIRAGDMVVLPSPSAVAAVAHWVRAWPEHVTLATVGEGTAKVIRSAWGDEVDVLYPEGDAEHSGSEALWRLVREHGTPSRVFFLRGQTGREWLPQRFREMGADVVIACAYVRVPIELNGKELARLQRGMCGPAPIVYVTSTDAVDAFMHALRPVPGAQEWAARGAAVTIHPRVAARLEEAGFETIIMTTTDDASVQTHIMELQQKAS